MSAPASAHPSLVLLVDRDQDTRLLYAQYLNRNGWQTLEAEDGRDALAQTYGARPTVIVTETRLPFIDGYDLCRLLRRDEQTAGLRLIVVTGDAYPGQIERARRAGADAVLTKPYPPDALGAEILRLTEAVDPPAAAAVVESATIPAGSTPSRRRVALTRAHQRYRTTTPPEAPPELVCPACDVPLQYRSSFVGGVSLRHPEQWDEFACPHACGEFQYRHRTRKLRQVA